MQYFTIIITTLRKEYILSKGRLEIMQ